jgi:signal transduction histidine kinase
VNQLTPTNRQPLVQSLRDARATLIAALDGQAATPEGARIASVLLAIESAEAALSIESAEAALCEQTPGTSGGHDSVEALAQRVAELTRAVALHDEFLSTLGHELRNPLAPIFMQAQYLLDVVRQGEPQALSREWMVPQLEGFCRRLHKFLEMLNRVMDVSRMSAGQLSLELEELDLVDVVRDVAASFERELSAARSELVLELPPHARGVWDRMRVEQIFTNLLSNAIRYAASKPIEVTVGGDLEQIELSVRDHGVGISEADRERIFQRFERAGKTRSSSGFGIGLWTVRQSCLAMGGQVSVKSEPGSGSEFIVMLPRVVEGERALR